MSFINPVNEATKLLSSIGVGMNNYDKKQKEPEYVKVLWDSERRGTYVKKRHGPL